MDKKEFIIKLPNKKDADELKLSGVFIFDSCSLLSVYSFTDKERKEFLSIMKKLSDGGRIWLPYQFLEEFEVHRLEKVREQHYAYDKFKELITSQFKDIYKSLDVNKFSEHKFLKSFEKKYRKEIGSFQKTILEKLQNAKENHPDWRTTDPVKRALMKCFQGKIGEAYTEEDERYKSLVKDGPTRYSRFIPPGYMDTEKNRTDTTKRKQFGDLIAWFQILDQAKKEQKPIAIVTDDLKEDWWNKQDGKLFGPRIELMYEIHEYAGVPLAMFNMEMFLKYAKERLEIVVQEALLEKVKKIDNENVTEESVTSNKDEVTVSQGPILEQNVSVKAEHGFSETGGVK